VNTDRLRYLFYEGVFDVLYFPPNSEFLLSVVDVSIASMVIGKKISGPDGNENLFKTFSRYYRKPVNLNKLKHSKAFISLLEHFCKRFSLDDEWLAENKDHLSEFTLDDLESDWSGFVFGSKMRQHFPETSDFITKIDKASQACQRLWDEGSRTPAISQVSDLPWAHLSTIQWYLGALKSPPRITPDAQFPAQLVGVFVALRFLSHEFEPEDSVVGWSLRELALSRHPETGELAAIRYFLDKTKAATGIPTNREFYELAISDYGNARTRQREAKKFRAGTSVPSAKMCLQIVDNVCARLSERSAAELRTLALIACFCQKAFLRCKKILCPYFDPISPFENIREIALLSKKELLA